VNFPDSDGQKVFGGYQISNTFHMISKIHLKKIITNISWDLGLCLCLMMDKIYRVIMVDVFLSLTLTQCVLEHIIQKVIQIRSSSIL
ncbi:hypothetical protein ACJX0J_011172, partial [Zea mays]